MRKLSNVMFLTLFSLILIAGSAYAIQGVCSNCHTMHNSQNGATMTADGSLHPQLLRASCVGCHTGGAGETGEKNSFGAPIVYHTTAPTGQGGGKTLAGGDFYWVHQTGGDTKGHNVSGIASEDQLIGGNAPGFTPPGWDPAATPGFNNDGKVNGGGADWGTTQLTCAGTNGCHGTHAAAGDTAIIGAHHGNANGTHNNAGGGGGAGSADTIGNSYRFLSGIYGLEEADWNWGETNALHNEYYGVAAPGSRDMGTTYGNKHTISYSCAECHGFFHSQIAGSSGGGSPWLRHPTDVVLPNSGDYMGYTTYSVEAPIARPAVLTSSNSTVTPGTDIVACVSCHRAHGSPEPDILRWTYANMVAGNGGSYSNTGCFTCHRGKD